MARIRLPQDYLNRIEIIKKAILIRSGFLSEFGNKDVKIELSDFDYEEKDGQLNFNELSFDLTITNLDCLDCDFEIDALHSELKTLHDRLIKSCKFGLTSDLKIKNGFDLRGIITHEIYLRHSTFDKIVFGLYFDPAGFY
jgi:hypothetical protein